jgi:hypothetical protein
MKGGGLALYNLIQPTISLEMPVPRKNNIFDIFVETLSLYIFTI